MPSKRETLKMVLILVGVLVTSYGCAPVPMNSQGGFPASSTVDLISAPFDLVVLHTNDNWGETEPCG